MKITELNKKIANAKIKMATDCGQENGAYFEDQLIADFWELGESGVNDDQERKSFLSDNRIDCSFAELASAYELLCDQVSAFSHEEF